MNADVAFAKPWRLSLRALLVLTAAAAFGCAGMMHANERWLVAFTTAALLAFMAAAVVATFDRGPRQAFALGFLLCGALHLAALRWVTDMPTRLFVEEAYERVSQEQFRLIGTSSGSMAADSAAAGGAASGQLKRGDTGPLVSALQDALNERMKPTPLLDVDGDFGVLTEQAVVGWQRFLGHPADGVVTVSDWRALGSAAREALKRSGAQAFVGMEPGEEFLPMGEWLVTLVVAMVGGYLAQAVYLRRKREAV